MTEILKTTTIRTPRLTLRPMTIKDAETFFEIRAHPEIYQWSLAGRYTDVSQAEAWITGHQDNPEGFNFMIDLNESKDSKSLPRTIGTTGIPAFPQPESHQKSVREIGFMLRPDAWGKGYATEAVSAVVKTVFEKTDVTHLTARTDEANRGSWNVLEKSGFKRVDRQEYENATLGKRIFLYYEIARPGYRVKGEQEKDAAQEVS